MAFQDLLTHTCDIYHLKSKVEPSSFGVPGETSYYYEAVADSVNVPCYFTPRESLRADKEEAPFRAIHERLKGVFNASADIRHNDKIVFNGVEYRTGNPIKIKSHHWEVTLEKL